MVLGLETTPQPPVAVSERELEFYAWVAGMISNCGIPLQLYFGRSFVAHVGMRASIGL